MLDGIFSDRDFRFTAPVDQTTERADPVYLNFDQLYLEAILSGTKTTGALRQKVSHLLAQKSGWRMRELTLRPPPCPPLGPLGS